VAIGIVKDASTFQNEIFGLTDRPENSRERRASLKELLGFSFLRSMGSQLNDGGVYKQLPKGPGERGLAYTPTSTDDDNYLHGALSFFGVAAQPELGVSFRGLLSDESELTRIDRRWPFGSLPSFRRFVPVLRRLGAL
jgi:hypothetical protein